MSNISIIEINKEDDNVEMKCDINLSKSEIIEMLLSSIFITNPSKEQIKQIKRFIKTK